MVRRLVAGAAGALVAAALAALPAQAQVQNEALSRCLVASTTEADRIAFVRWMFMAMSKHPQVADLTTVTEQQRADATRTTALLLQRLVITDCRQQALEAFRVSGLDGISTAFEVVGEVAVGGLITHPAVNAQFESLATYQDTAAWEKFARDAQR